MKFVRHLLAVLCLISIATQPVIAIQSVKLQDTSLELRFEYAMAKLGSKTFTLQETAAQTKNSSFLEIEQKKRTTIGKLATLLYTNQTFFHIAEEYSKNLDASVQKARVLLKQMAQELNISLSDNQFENRSISEKIDWVENGIHLIIKEYKKLAPHIKSSKRESLGRAILLNRVTKRLPLSEFTTWGAQLNTLFGLYNFGTRLANHVSKTESVENSLSYLITGLGAHLLYLSTSYAVGHLDDYKTKLLEKESKLDTYNKRKK